MVYIIFAEYCIRNLVSYRRPSFHVIPLRHVFEVAWVDTDVSDVYVLFWEEFITELHALILLSISQQLILCFESVEEMAG